MSHLSRYPLDVHIVDFNGVEISPMDPNIARVDAHGRLIPSPELVEELVQQRLAAVAQELRASAQATRESGCGFPQLAAVATALDAVAAALDPGGELVPAPSRRIPAPNGYTQKEWDDFLRNHPEVARQQWPHLFHDPGSVVADARPAALPEAEVTPTSRCCGAPTFRDGSRLICDKCRTSKPV